MKKQRLAILATIGLVAGLLGVAAPAAANAGNSAYCTGAWVCVYKDSWWSIALGWRSPGFALENISAANNNTVSSWENRSGTNARWYTDGGGQGTCHTMARYSELAWMDPFTQNDNMSSWAGNGSC